MDIQNKTTPLYWYRISGYARYDTGHEIIEIYDDTEQQSECFSADKGNEKILDMFDHSISEFSSQIESFLKDRGITKLFKNRHYIDNLLTLEFYKFEIDKNLYKKYLSENNEESSEAKEEINELIYEYIDYQKSNPKLKLVNFDIQNFTYSEKL